MEGQWVHEVVDWMLVARTVADELVGIGAELIEAMARPEDALRRLREVAGLLREAADEAETLFADATVLVPAGTAPLPDAAIVAGAMLVAEVFDLPLSLRRAVNDATFLLAHVTDISTLQVPLHQVRVLASSHDLAGVRFILCRPHLGVLEPGDAAWRRWRRHNAHATDHGKLAQLRLGRASTEALEALRAFESPRRVESVPLLEEILRDVANEVERALVAMQKMRRDITDELMAVWGIIKRQA